MISGAAPGVWAIIFGAMKPAAYILTLLMLFLIVQPIVVECVAASSAEPAKAACKMKRSCPMKPACTEEDENNNECERSASCNPFASCSQCHFVNASKFLYAPAMGMVRDSRTIMAGEKLVAGFIADCWQPPEFVLLHTTN